MLKLNLKATLNQAMKAFHNAALTSGASTADIENIATRYGLDPDAFLAHIEYETSDGESGAKYEVTQTA